MSGRAVRRALQRQREAELLATPEAESSSEAEEPAAPAPKPSLFALLGGDDDDENPESEEEEEKDEEPAPVAQAAAPPKSKNKKKKKKKKAKKETKNVEGGTEKAEEEEDDIDRALRQLKVESKDSDKAEADDRDARDDDAALVEVLKIDSRNLDAGSEMRRLFGRDALRGDAPEPDPRARGMGRGRGRGGTGGRAMPTRRRNPFVQPKEDWPNTGSGGLGMEVRSGSAADEKLREHEREGDFTEYAFVHSRAYQDVQRQFMMCVESMDPQRMIQLLQHNPYHVTTLLQCSEIFHHQRDFNVAGDLLEKALFTMGRSLHSTFPASLASGKARLSFRRPENRDLYLSIWRYIKNLSQRGTWRSAAEFGFLLFSLDPFGDPYETSLLLDFLCLKARQTDRLLTLVEHPSLRTKFLDRPNIAFSRAIAHHQLGNAAEAQEYLAKAITKFPWIPGMLAKELNVDIQLSQALWGVFPPDDNPRQQLLAALYIEQHKDLWKEPALMSIFRDTVATIHSLPRKSPLANTATDVTVAMARHLHLLEISALTRYIPASIRKAHITHSFDALIPLDNIQSYDPTPPRPSNADIAQQIAAGPMDTVAAFLRTLLPWIDAGDQPMHPEQTQDEIEERRESIRELRMRLEEQGVPVEEILRDVRRAAAEDGQGTGAEWTQAGDMGAVAAALAEGREGGDQEAEESQDRP